MDCSYAISDPSDPSDLVPAQRLTPTMLFDLSGQTALVTGGSRGLGREMAFAFAEQGADVAICSRNADELAGAAEQIRAATGRRVLAVAADVTLPADVQRLADAAL